MVVVICWYKISHLEAGGHGAFTKKYQGKPGEDKLWKLGCHSGPVSWRNGLIFITGSKADVTGDERLQPHFTLTYLHLIVQ